MEAKTIKVKAIGPGYGYYNNKRIRVGQIFDMAADVYQPEGKKPCKWVEPVEGFEVDQDSGAVVAKTKKKAKE